MNHRFYRKITTSNQYSGPDHSWSLSFVKEQRKMQQELSEQRKQVGSCSKVMIQKRLFFEKQIED